MLLLVTAAAAAGCPAAGWVLDAASLGAAVVQHVSVFKPPTHNIQRQKEEISKNLERLRVALCLYRN